MMHGTEIQTSTVPYMPVIRATTTFCEVCGYPNHKASQCLANNRKTECNQYFAYNNQKNLKKTLKPKQAKSSLRFDKLFHIYAVMPTNGLILSHVKLQSQTSFKALIDTGAFAKVIPRTNLSRIASKQRYRLITSK